MSPLFYVIGGGGGGGGGDVVRDCNPIPDGLLDEFDFQLIFLFFYVHFCEILPFATCLKRTFQKSTNCSYFRIYCPRIQKKTTLATITKYIVVAKVKVFE